MPGQTPTTSSDDCQPNQQGCDDRLGRRPWPSTLAQNDIELSFEFFPAKTAAGLDNLVDAANELSAYRPKFASVTYGAGGTSQDRTIETLTRLSKETDLTLAGHLTTVAASKAQTLEVVDAYREIGVHHIVALRGDPPQSDVPLPTDGFETAADLVAGIREHAGDSVEISVAAYPEVHPKAESASADLQSLKTKIEAGADRALTQFFYDNDAFIDFAAKAEAAGIAVPIAAGLMPVANISKISNFASQCGTVIPEWLTDVFGGLDDAPSTHQLLSAAVAGDQARDLAGRGVRHFHFYTMNKAPLTAAACRLLGVRPNHPNPPAG